MTEIHETELPGIGVRQEFDTVSGARLGVLTTRSGRRELLLYDEDDPDSCRAVVHLDPEDSVVLADLLGSTYVASAASLQRLEGLAIDWLPVVEGSGFVGRTIADGMIRTRTGVSIVAVIRGSDTFPAPAPEFEFAAGDLAVAVGTLEGLELTPTKEES